MSAQVQDFERYPRERKKNRKHEMRIIYVGNKKKQKNKSIIYVGNLKKQENIISERQNKDNVCRKK